MHLSLRRVVELDGLRGGAIGLVLVFHLLAKPLDGLANRNVLGDILANLGGVGWLGVDLFFVLSGYLITRILVQVPRDFGSLGWFWVRRFFRIVPVYYIGLALYFGLLPFVLPPDTRIADDLLRGEGWLWTYTSNVGPALAGAWTPIPGPLYHTWSLSLEEQFYLLWPLAVLGALPSRVRWLSLALIFGAPLVRVIAVLFDVAPLALYISLPSRVDALAMGGLLAVTGGDERVRSAWIGWAALLILVGWFLVGGPSQYGAAVQTIGYSAAAVVSGFAVQVALSGEDGWLRRFLRNPLMVYLGRRSYALYLVHPLVAAVAVYGVRIYGGFQEGMLAVMLGATVAFVVSLLLSELSWRLIERPLLRFRVRLAPDRSKAI